MYFFCEGCKRAVRPHFDCPLLFSSCQAAGVLRHYALELLSAKRLAPDAAPVDSWSITTTVPPPSSEGAGAMSGALRRLDKAALESCLSVVVMALAVVMAGTGAGAGRDISHTAR